MMCIPLEVKGQERPDTLRTLTNFLKLVWEESKTAYPAQKNKSDGIKEYGVYYVDWQDY